MQLVSKNNNGDFVFNRSASLVFAALSSTAIAVTFFFTTIGAIAANSDKKLEEVRSEIHGTLDGKVDKEEFRRMNEIMIDMMKNIDGKLDRYIERQVGEK